MNKTEKSLPQGLQDMLSAHRKYTAQANDINNEIIDREMKTLHLPLKAVSRPRSTERLNRIG